MRTFKLSLSFALFVGFLLMEAVPAWAGAIPKKTPSDYGANDEQVQLTTPTSTAISQNGVNISLDSVFCTADDCASDPVDPTGQQLSYFFAITMDSGSQLDSLTFGPDFNDFGVTVFDGSFTCASGTTCIPTSTDGLSFDNVGITTTCVSTGCTSTFTNFNPQTIGIGTIIFAAGTPLDSVLNLNGVPQTPLFSATTSSTTVPVPEPGSVWFAVIATLVCLAGITRRQRILSC
jgi:hypothetical protein